LILTEQLDSYVKTKKQKIKKINYFL